MVPPGHDMSKKHTILMIACCAIGMGGVLAVLVFKIPVNNVVFALMLLLCPLSHLLMMGMPPARAPRAGVGGHKDHEQHDHAQMEKSQSTPKSLPGA